MSRWFTTGGYPGGEFAVLDYAPDARQMDVIYTACLSLNAALPEQERVEVPQ